MAEHWDCIDGVQTLHFKLETDWAMLYVPAVKAHVGVLDTTLALKQKDGRQPEKLCVPDGPVPVNCVDPTAGHV